MPVDDLGDYDVAPVEGNPFGSMADSPHNYDVAPVDHDPFASVPDQFELASRQPEATPSSAGGPPLDPSDRDLLIKTVYGEASGEPALGQAGVTHAILNRVRAGGYGQGIAGVVKAPAAGVNPKLGYHEFSPWNTGSAKEGNPRAQNLPSNDPSYARIGDVVDKAYSGLIPDPTHGATHYYGYMPHPPKWAPPLAAQNTVKIGHQTFVGGAEGPGRAPSRTATGYAGGGPVQLNEHLRRRLELITQPRSGFADGGAPDDPEGPAISPPADPNAAGFAAINKMVQDERASTPEPAPAPQPPQPQLYGGAWGQSAEDAYQYGMGKLADAQNWAGNQLEKHLGTAAAAVGLPNASGFARDIRAMTLDMPGESGGPREAPSIARNSEGALRHVDEAFPESRISTSAPWAVGSDPHGAGGNDVSMQLARGDNPLADGLPAYLDSAYHKNANTIRGVNDQGGATRYTVPFVRLPDAPVGAGPGGALTAEQHLAHDDATHEALINHMESNIEAVYNAVPDETKPGSAKWYNGGHEITKGIALDHDIPHENAAGVVAALSPQKDWDMNVNLARRVAHVLSTTPADARATPEMTQWMQNYAATKPLTRDKLILDPRTKKPEVDPRTGQPTGRTKTIPAITTQQDVLDDLDRITSKPWSQMDADDRAIYIRAYDEAHGPPDHLMVRDDRTGAPLPKGFHINNPDGSPSSLVSRYGPEFTNMVDQPTKVTWGSNNEIANAVKAYHAENMSQISEAMGDGHKVRSFYNNLIAPNSAGHDVTGDTHAVATGLLRPLGAGSDEVALGLGQTGSGTAATGVQGLYPNVREAYRRVAERAGLLPRQMQSIVWEAVRGLWSPAQKRQATLKNSTDALWRQYENGQVEADHVQRQLLGPNGSNISRPRWQGSWKP